MIPQLQREQAAAVSESAPQWSTATKIGFRFAFSYFLLYVAPGPVGSLSPYKQVASVDTGIWGFLWHPVVSWVGTSLLHLSGNLQEVPNGSGDELYDYVLWLCIAVLAAVATVVWSIMDRKRTNYRQLNEWLRLFMRMTVGWGMLGYGVKKLVGAQFPPPTLARLVQPFAQASPTGLLWTFMGASPAYSLFGGIGETLGGALILVPGLVTLGSLISAAMMTNVLMLNLGYDVPRKIFSIHLILMCLYLLLPEARRLANVFLFNRRADPVPQIPLFRDRQWNRAAIFLPLVFGVYVFLVAGHQSILDANTETATLSSPIRGIWAVQEFAVDGAPEALRLGDPKQWQNVIFDQPKILTIQTMNGQQVRYYMQLDDAQKTIKLWNTNDLQWRAVLHADTPQADQMTIEGEFGSQKVTAKLARMNLSDPQFFYLTNRGFHWVNPYVNNR
jgi:uncharacterized membrane protein YphA (DoxX/SURF4 family)